MNFLKEILSDSPKGTLSSKRVMGSFSLLVCLGCIVFLVITEGGILVVENLLQTAMLLAAGLLGISSVTKIWDNKYPNSKPKE